MDGNLIASVAATAFALASAYYTRGQVLIAKDQTDLQRQIARQASEPLVWVDIRPDDHQGAMLRLLLGNSGPTVARDVRVTFAPPLPVPAKYPAAAKESQDRLAAGIASLAPGRVVSWGIGLGREVLADDGPQVHRVRIECAGPAGLVEPVEYLINLADWRESADSPFGSLHYVRKAIQELTQEVKKRPVRTVRRQRQVMRPTSRP